MDLLTDIDEQLALLRDDNERLKQQLGTMRGLAFRDQLTGLFSRRYLTEFLEEEIVASAATTSIVLALCDIDDFKLINDTRGHHSGDIAIACIADILDDGAEGQPVIRWGGEELLLVLFSTSEQEALRLCNDLRQQVAAYRINDGLSEFSCTITIGLAPFDPALPFADSFARVDRALYQGKESGKNRCVIARDTAKGTD